MAGRITDVPGISVGCWTDPVGLTGCTVVLCPDGAVVAADVRGGAPGTRDTDLARPGMLVQRAQAVLLTGGSAFGLDAAGGVLRWLEARGHGQPVPGGVVPIVPSAVVFDLAVGDFRARPAAAEGHAACEAAGSDVPEGNAGAGTGCTVSKLRGREQAWRGGQGTAAAKLEGYTVGSLMVVNAVGDVVDPATGAVIAGPSSAAVDQPGAGPTSPLNTTIGVVATDAPLTKDQALRVAWMAHDGLARAIRPAHTLFDGDTVFVLSTAPPDSVSAAAAAPAATAAQFVSAVGAIAADLVAEAVVRAVLAATPAPGLPAVRGPGA